jgi:hypothetical protein
MTTKRRILVPVLFPALMALGKIARYFSLPDTTSAEPPRRQRHSIRMVAGLAKTGMGSADCVYVTWNSNDSMRQGLASVAGAPRLRPDPDFDHGGDVRPPFHDRIENAVIGALGDQHVMHGQIIDAG